MLLPWIIGLLFIVLLGLGYASFCHSGPTSSSFAAGICANLASTCPDGITKCDPSARNPCQMCPGGMLCPGSDPVDCAMPSPGPGPEPPTGGTCPDGSGCDTRSCSYCADGSLCPGSNPEQCCRCPDGTPCPFGDPNRCPISPEPPACVCPDGSPCPGGDPAQCPPVGPVCLCPDGSPCPDGDPSLCSPDPLPDPIPAPGGPPPSPDNRFLWVGSDVQDDATLWIQTKGFPGYTGPFKLLPGQTLEFQVPPGFIVGSRVWTMEGCDSEGQNCLVGQSAAEVSPDPGHGFGYQPPIDTKAEFTWGVPGGSVTWYNLSNVDGFTRQASIYPLPATSDPTYDCTEAHMRATQALCPTAEPIPGLGTIDLTFRADPTDPTSKVYGCMAPCKGLNFPHWGRGLSEEEPPAIDFCCPTPCSGCRWDLSEPIRQCGPGETPPGNDPASPCCDCPAGCGPCGQVPEGQPRPPRPTMERCNRDEGCITPSACRTNPDGILNSQYVQRLIKDSPDTYSYAYDEDRDGVLRTCPYTTDFLVVFR
jgi:hypothetical protein